MYFKICILIFALSLLAHTSRGYEIYRNRFKGPSGRNSDGLERDESPQTSSSSLSAGASNDLSSSYAKFIFEIFGASSGKLRSMALSLIVYLAEYVTKSMFNVGENDILTNEIPQYRSLVENEGYIAAVMQLFENSEKHAQDWVEFIEDEDLPNNLIQLLYERTGSATNCAQMFICKTGPLISGLQKSIKSRQAFRDFSKSPMAPRSYDAKEDESMWRSLYSNLPSARALLTNNNQCESRSIDCPLLSF